MSAPMIVDIDLTLDLSILTARELVVGSPSHVSILESDEERPQSPEKTTTCERGGTNNLFGPPVVVGQSLGLLDLSGSLSWGTSRCFGGLLLSDSRLGRLCLLLLQHSNLLAEREKVFLECQVTTAINFDVLDIAEKVGNQTAAGVFFATREEVVSYTGVRVNLAIVVTVEQFADCLLAV
ncbi:hypothetical protein HG530_010440 [Fusarium avenaceum]|nr:hypothetical protein HG530_010440 [Fusarium avenaceum]